MRNSLIRRCDRNSSFIRDRRDQDLGRTQPDPPGDLDVAFVTFVLIPG